MLQATRGIVLRSVKYGETSLISTIFTEQYGVRSYLVKGVRTNKTRNSRAGLLQPATLLDLSVYFRSQKNLQHLREFHPAHVYRSLQEEVVKNSIALFSVELLLRLLPEHAPLPELFEFSFNYFSLLDETPVNAVANFPLYFIIQCSHLLGYEVRGTYSNETPHLNLQEGAFTSDPPPIAPFLNDDDTRAMDSLLQINEYAQLNEIQMNATIRFRLLDWYIAFLHQHTQHLGHIRSLTVLQAILH
jgi:DNA repair protein RecO (recombination protein O)